MDVAITLIAFAERGNLNHMMRIALFLLTNLAVMLVFGLVLSLTGVQHNSMMGLIIMAGLFGFGGSIVSLLMSKWMALRSVGGEVIEQPRNETERWLLDTVRMQSQQVGIAMPQVAIYHAPDINAFATGARRDSSLVAVSTGLLQSMSRDEAEAVIAHEISHIANGDMVTMTLVQGVVNTFVIFISRIIAQIATSFLSGNRDDNEESGNGNPLVYMAISMVLELVFGILASIITMWFSRYREFHADAGSARLVGREKMIAALQRLKTSYEPQEAGSMMAFCINGKSKSLSEMFMSHPPLDKRIDALRTGEYLK
ncbi:Zinc metalloprotease HtpX, membrane-bound; cleaves SecY in vivo [Dickeya aquatica]|uniref:Protease HtpX n=2 Tax=Pectobacteriaceae TaxID=1903410 RepID=A0A375ABH1_9GAMM|nr:Zinc metalloprotease HtpX, membrane-bound; cleaves SecY in vivo [Dickeya aquatica]